MKNLRQHEVAGTPIRESGERRERPILFTGAMVRAILEGRKTQTRRLATVLLPGDKNYIQAESAQEWRTKRAAQCPYGKPGDRLWVRETWTFINMSSEQGDVCIAYNADGDDLPNRISIKIPESEITHLWEVRDIWAHRKRPSIFMPRWASRITLELTSVHVERLQDISCPDVMAEGSPIPMRQHSSSLGLRCDSAKANWFIPLWDSINHKKAPWSSNPFVWVLSFRAGVVTE